MVDGTQVFIEANRTDEYVDVVVMDSSISTRDVVIVVVPENSFSRQPM